MIIEKDVYSKIHSLIPIPCVDLVIIRDNRILLVRRKLEPAKGQYWFPGGRIMRNESFVNATKRLAKAEVGLDIDIKKIAHIGIGNLLFPTDPFGHGQGTHSVTFVFKCVVGNDNPILDQNHDEFIWWDGSSGDHHAYVKNYAAKAKLTM
jgi:colanic acid biosynthesis protein WcaH